MSDFKSIKSTIEAQNEVSNIMGQMAGKTAKIEEVLANSTDLSLEERQELETYLEEAKKHEDELDAIHEEFKEVNEQFLADYDNVVKEDTLTGIMNNMQGLIEKYKEEEKLEMAAHYTGILAELKNSISLQPMFDKIPEIKNIGKIANIDEKRINKTMRKVNDKFAKERRYSFMPIQTTYESLLINNFSKEDSLIFINFLCGHILPLNFEKFEGKAFFISQLQQNIVKLGAFDMKEELTYAINKIVSTIKENR